MQAIINFFSSVIDGIIAIVDFVISTIKDIVYMVQLVGDTLVQLPDFIGSFLPESVVTALMLIFSVVVIYKIIGREG